MKKWYRSWTVWFNLGLLAVAIINEVAKIIPMSAEFLSVVAVIGNLLLRIKTTSEIYFK
ncbi:MAG: hypothetical protein RBR98_04005 [Candidatus Moranbacteria bacterium]|jgi:hypothetical protein|nr:hypothetical protein [Candidatus Moranbacteria bacterium]